MAAVAQQTPQQQQKNKIASTAVQLRLFALFLPYRSPLSPLNAVFRCRLKTTPEHAVWPVDGSGGSKMQPLQRCYCNTVLHRMHPSIARTYVEQKCARHSKKIAGATTSRKRVQKLQHLSPSGFTYFGMGHVKGGGRSRRSGVGSN